MGDHEGYKQRRSTTFLFLRFFAILLMVNGAFSSRILDLDNGLPFAQAIFRLTQVANGSFDGVCDAWHTCPPFAQVLA